MIHVKSEHAKKLLAQKSLHVRQKRSESKDVLSRRQAVEPCLRPTNQSGSKSALPTKAFPQTIREATRGSKVGMKGLNRSLHATDSKCDYQQPALKHDDGPSLAAEISAVSAPSYKTHKVRLLHERIATDPWRQINNLQQKKHEAETRQQIEAAIKQRKEYAKALAEQVNMRDQFCGRIGSSDGEEAERLKKIHKELESENRQRERERLERVRKTREEYANEMARVQRQSKIERLSSQQHALCEHKKIQMEIENERKQAKEKHEKACQNMRQDLYNSRLLWEEQRRKTIQEKRLAKQEIPTGSQTMQHLGLKNPHTKARDERHDAFLESHRMMYQAEIQKRDDEETRRLSNQVQEWNLKEERKEKEKQAARQAMNAMHVRDLDHQRRHKEEIDSALRSQDRMHDMNFIETNRKELEAEKIKERKMRETNLANRRVIERQRSLDRRRKESVQPMTEQERAFNRAMLQQTA